jgi:uncharacterized RDD family membrane protein YckC
VLFGAIFFLCDFFSSMPGMSGRLHSLRWPPASNRSYCAATEGKQVLSKSASLPAEPFDAFDPQSNEAASGTPAWKQEVNQRLAAHRNRRGGPQDAAARTQENPRPASDRAAAAAARVAARYAKAPSYSQLLAGEARAVVRAAGAAAEAARNAQAAAQAVLAGLESGSMTPELWEREPHASETVSHAAVSPPPATPPRWQDEPPPVVSAPSAQAATQQVSYAGAQPRWEEALPVTAPAAQSGRDVWSEMRVHPGPEPTHEYRRDSERHYGHGYEQRIDEGELFPDESFDSYDPMGSAIIEPVQHLPANLIEFPRELVATRKARPRLAEGPFYDASHENSQLSIFEVDPKLLDSPVYRNDASASAVAPPEWASIELDHLEDDPESQYYGVVDNQHIYGGQGYATAEVQASHADVSEMHGSAVQEMPVEMTSIPVANVSATSTQFRSATPVPVGAVAELLVARLSDRILAAVVDGALITLAFLAAAVVVVASTTHPPAGRMALIASGFGWLLFGLLYQFLFLSYAEEGTPGMRYARIALCTFDDDNPTREQMRMRIPAMLLSALPAGLGLFWAFFDGEHLGWHDRMTRTYQRKY